jgi:hypothetical protein
VSLDPKGVRFCDECGRTLVKASRIHLGNEYCATCYQRTFKSVPCSRCSKPMRAHKNAAAPPVCDACERAARVCLRCGKPTPVAGRLVEGGAVCAACAPHYAEPKTCPSCGVARQRLSKSEPFEVAVCDHCRNQTTHATCTRCRRYRLVATSDPYEAPLCADCLPGIEATHACPDCGTTVVGGGRGRCRACINRVVVREDAVEAASAMAQPWCETLWTSYVEHRLHEHAESSRLRQNLTKDASFFRLLGDAFAALEDVTPAAMGRRIPSAVLRRHLIASRFVLGERDLGELTEQRSAKAETERSANVIGDAEGQPYQEVLQQYGAWLQGKGTALRTARLYLRSAETYAKAVRLQAGTPWQRETMVAFLRKNPGLGANLGRFTTFCREHLSWDVAMPPKADWTGHRSAERLTQRKLAQAIKEMSSRPSGSWTTKELARVLSLSLGIPAEELVRMRASGTIRRLDGSIAIATDAVVAPRHPLYAYAVRWAERAQALCVNRGR